MTDTQADLVARLRDLAVWMHKHLDYMEDEISAVHLAADELERLRASNKQLREALENVRGDITMLTRQGEDYIWRPVKRAIDRIDAALKDAQGDKT